jgi:hypothetical protein
MLAFEVSVNGKRVCTAGVGQYGVLSSILSTVKKRRRRRLLWLEVGGLRAGDPAEERVHLSWLGKKRISIGDEITIRTPKTTPVSHQVWCHGLEKFNHEGHEEHQENQGPNALDGQDMNFSYLCDLRVLRGCFRGPKGRREGRRRSANSRVPIRQSWIIVETFQSVLGATGKPKGCSSQET